MSATIEPTAPHLDDDARGRLAALLAEVESDPRRISVLFPAVGRRVARGPSNPADPDGLRSPRLEDEARAALLVAAAARLERAALVEEVGQLYRYGDADEKRAVLRALPALDLGDAGLPLVADALRTNDVRLVAAALGPYAARHLDAAAWRQGVLKCLFVGVPLDAVADLDARGDEELARMVADYGNERVAAGRSVPSDAWRILGRHPEAVAGRFPVPAQED
ncbi:EboA domain-containing protein [Jiangella endophytica]|uniref:EboA domain-containing protein n=1 Tax=Jiangella endophytica TaxID=1623398 RepID=UPI000E3524E2|nr:EboA domain-containing protein [Jiangella endophytica]